MTDRYDADRRAIERALTDYVMEPAWRTGDDDPAPQRGDVWRDPKGDEWVVCALDAEQVYLASARPVLGLVVPRTVSRGMLATEYTRGAP